MTDLLSDLRIAEHAALITRIYDLGSETSVDVVELVRVLGGAIEGEHATKGEHALTVRGKGDFTVTLQPMTSSADDRFEVAAGIGRYLLHWRQLGLEDRPAAERLWQYPRGAGDGWLDGYRFAMALLMPERAFRRVHLEHAGDARAIATVFGVPFKKASARAHSLRLPIDNR